MHYDLENIWQKTINILSEDLSATVVDQWIRPMVPVMVEKDCFVLALGLEVAMFRSLIINTCEKPIAAALSGIFEREMSVRFIYVSEMDQMAADLPANFEKTNLIAKYTFDNFVVGTSNNFAQAAALAVAENPFRAYNPLFLYGPSGLGKTHLMHAIGNFILQKDPAANVMYVTSEAFTNDLINSIKEKKMESFRDKYRKVDVLLIDDIQFIAGKEATEEEFFHTFNHLHQANNQIIISSDRPPRDMQILEERLRSRFEWGLTCDLKPPSYETRLAILQKKAAEESINAPDDALEYIANNISSNIREMEGALNKIKAFSQIGKVPITVSLCETLLMDTRSNVKRIYTTDQIKKVACDYFDVSLEDMMSQKRNKEISFARQMAMYLCRKFLDTSLPRIGQDFGGRDHTTVLHAIKKIESEMHKNAETMKTVNDIIAAVENS